MNFTVTYQAQSEQEFRRLIAEFGGAVTAPRVRRTKEQIKQGIPLEALKEEAGIHLPTYEAGEISAPDESEFDD